MMRGIIFEGIPGSGKTTLKSHLLRMIAGRDCSAILLDESVTERSLEPLKKATLEDSLRLLGDISGLLENFKNLSCKFTGNLLKLFILERFHWSHCLDIAGPDHFAHYQPIEDTMHTLNTTVVLLTIGQASVLDRSVIRTRQTRPLSWTRYLSTFGDTDEDVAGHYLNQQEQFFTLAGKTSLQVLHYDTTRENWENLAVDLTSKIFQSSSAT